MSDIGVRVQGANRRRHLGSASRPPGRAARSNKAGVNLDEEAARLIQFQQATRPPPRCCRWRRPCSTRCCRPDKWPRPLNPPSGSDPHAHLHRQRLRLSIDQPAASRQTTWPTRRSSLTSGKRVPRQRRPDRCGAGRARAGQRSARVDANQRALDASRNAMTLTEGAMGDANELLQQARETIVSAGNASYSDAERKSLAE
jgi:hypothetical protein